MIIISLPTHLKTLAKVTDDIELDIDSPVTIARILDALESRYPTLVGTIRERGTLKRREFVRFFACNEDVSHHDKNAPLPDSIATGAEPFLVVGAIAGG